MEDFKTMDQMMEQPKLAYCDYIVSLIRKALTHDDHYGLLGVVGPVQYDLDEGGAMRSTAKVVELTDAGGKKYRVTVQEL